jgi:hypothetical protein
LGVLLLFTEEFELGIMFAAVSEEMDGSNYGITFHELGIVIGIGIPPGQFRRNPAMGLQIGPSGSTIYTHEGCPFGRQWRVELHSGSKSR